MAENAKENANTKTNIQMSQTAVVAQP